MNKDWYELTEILRHLKYLVETGILEFEQADKVVEKLLKKYLEGK